MSIAVIWDRFWWSLMWMIFIGLVWLKFIDPIFPYIIVSFIISGTFGTIYFIVGIRKILKKDREEEEIERKAREEIIIEFGREATR